MNKVNLLKMADYIETVPQKFFDMKTFGIKDSISHNCKTVGCIIGHCVVLDDPENIPRCKNNTIDFVGWEMKFTNTPDDVWEYLFGEEWINVDNTPTGAAKRIRHLVEDGLPENWREQSTGVDPLSYLV